MATKKSNELLWGLLTYQELVEVIIKIIVSIVIYYFFLAPKEEAENASSDGTAFDSNDSF